MAILFQYQLTLKLDSFRILFFFRSRLICEPGTLNDHLEFLAH